MNNNIIPLPNGDFYVEGQSNKISTHIKFLGVDYNFSYDLEEYIIQKNQNKFRDYIISWDIGKEKSVTTISRKFE